MTLEVLGDVNYLAVVVATIAWWVLGAVWYAPPVFGRAWQQATGVTVPEGQRAPIGPYILSYVAYFVTALTIAVLALLTGTDTYGEGVLLGLVTGIGFSGVLLFVGLIFEQRKPAWFWINGIYNLIGYTLVAVIVALWD
jgi:hypothetical protein